MHDYDYSLPDFSQPSLSADPAALEQPGLTLPNPQHSDPYLPDLLQPLIPADLELHATTIPAQALLDLPTNQATAELRQPDPARSEYQSQLQSPTQDGPVAINLAPPLATLADEAFALADASPDRRQLPPDLTSAHNFLTQDGMSHRRRHLAPLLLSLHAQGEEHDGPHSA